MNLSILNSPAAPFFFNAFEAFPEQGLITVPVRIHSLTNALESRPLTPETVAPFASTLGAAITEIAREFPPRLPIAALPCLGGAWTAMHAGVKHLLLENASEGKSLVFDRGARLTQKLTGHTSGLALAVKQWGGFSSRQMSQALSLKHRMRWLPTAYEMRFDQCAVTGLKEFMGLPRDIPILELGTCLYKAIDLTGYEAQLSIRADSESLTIDVHTQGPDQKLPPTLKPFWAFSKELSERYPHR